MAENELQRVEPPQSPIMKMAEMVNQSDGKIDAAGLKELLAVQMDWEANEARKAYHEAMAGFHAEAPKIIKQRDGHNGKYAGLSDIVSVIAPIESKYGLSHTWVTSVSEKEIKVTCKITHVLGHTETTELTAAPDTSGSKNAIQALGSTITYLERYTLKAALGLAESGQDDDGNGTGEKPPFEIPDPSDKEQIVIEAIALKIPAPDGMRVDPKKLRPIFFGEYQRYPADMQYVDSQAEWISGMGLRHIYMPDKPKDEFDEFVEQQGDMPAADAEATAAEKFGKENEIVECRFVCNHCSNEYDTFKKIDQCPKCLHRDVTDRRPE